MRVTIVEKEIHTAIQNYIHSIMSIREGCDIKVDLKATRGDHGYTAEIDITPPSDKPLAIERKVEEARSSDTVDAGSSDENGPSGGQNTDQPEQEPETEEASESESEQAEEASEGTSEESEPEEEEAPAPKKQSLFAGMDRPKN